MTNTYPLLPVPALAGLYSLRNTRTGEFYVGKAIDLRRRHQEWRAAFSNGRGFKSAKMADAATNPHEWTFAILSTYETITPQELDKLERQAIASFSLEHGDRLLNTMGTETKSGQAKAAVDILDEHGLRLTYSETARRLGCKLKSVSKRMAKYRDRGQMTVEFAELQELTRAYRLPKKSLEEKSPSVT